MSGKDSTRRMSQVQIDSLNRHTKETKREKAVSLYDVASRWYRSQGKEVSTADSYEGQKMIAEYLEHKFSQHDKAKGSSKETVRLPIAKQAAAARKTISFESEPVDMLKIKTVAGKKVILPYKSTYSEKDKKG